jgi:hypothetical protein
MASFNKTITASARIDGSVAIDKDFRKRSAVNVVAGRKVTGMSDDQKRLCFVIGPIGDAGSDSRTHADWLLNGIIKPVFLARFPDYSVERADEIKAPGDINSQVINRLMTAALVIADMSMHNANAFYELAVRHMVRLPTIHIIHKDWKIPFDVAPYRAIHFARKDYNDIEHARSELESVVRDVTKEGFEVENPITHARAKFELDQHATPALLALASELAALRGKIAGLEEEVATNRELTSLQLGVPPTTGLTHFGAGFQTHNVNRNRLLFDDSIRQDLQTAMDSERQ